MGDLTPIILKACLAVVPTLKEEDFMFTIEALDRFWDVYRVTLSDGQVGQIAFTMDHQNEITFGWLGPRERSPEDIKHLLTRGFNTTIPDA
jgi:hypothetical protein